MAFLKSLRGNGDQIAAAKAELTELAKRMRDERQSLERLIGRAQGASKTLATLADPVARMDERLAALERQTAAIEQRLPGVVAAQDRAAALAERQRGIETQLTASGGELARIQARLGELGRLVETAGTLERNLTRFLDLGGPFQALQAQADELKARVGEISESYGDLRQRQERLAQSSTEGASRIEGIEGAGQAALRTVEDCRRRTEELEQSIGRLTQVAAGAAEAKRQLLSLKSLADQITQKAAALENQRDALERVARDVSRLDDLVQRVDSAIRQQEDQISHLHTLATDVGDLRQLYDSVATRSEEISAHQQEVEEQEHATRQTLTDLGDQLRRATERFELEHRGLDTVSQRISDLRGMLKDCEERLGGVEAAARIANELQGKAEKLWTRVGFLTGEVATLNETPDRIRVLRADAQRLQDLLQAVSTRTAEIEKAKPAIDAVLHDLGTLSRSHEAIRDALDLMQTARDEVALARTDHAETETRLTVIQRSLADVEERAGRIDAFRPTVEAVRRDVEQVVTAIDVVASRRQFLDETQTRLVGLAALGAQLDDRTKAFRSRLDLAEGRFVAVTKQAEDAGRIAALVTTVSGTVTDAGHRTSELVRSIAAFEERSQNLQGIAERVRLLGQEIEQRERALEKASAHLARASELRQDAAGAVQQLEERTRAAQRMVEAVEQRTGRLEDLSQELDGHSAKLRTVTRGVEQLDELLRGWETAKLDLHRSLDQVAARQSTVTVMQADIRQMFELAERTANDLKAAVAAQREIRESKASLDELLERLHDADAATSELQQRKQEIEHAEERLGRAEALLIDIQSTLETLNNQKAMFDRVMEQAGSLTFQVQQAEGLIDRLRKEREITSSVRTALEDSANRAARPGVPLRRTLPESS